MGQRTIFVTGGSGFVGGHVIEALVARGDVVWAMARSDASAAVVEGFGARAVRCALGEVPAAALEGCEAIVHCAGYVEEWGTRAQYEAGNVAGTAQLLEAARAAGVGRLVFISSEAALFDGHDLINIDERTPYPARHQHLYPETKARAEQLALAAHGPGLDVVVLRPRLIWGPRDRSVLPAVLEMIARGQFAWIDGGLQETSTTHVLNLCRAVELALDVAPGGEVYFVCDDERHTVRDFLGGLIASQGVAVPTRSAPSALLRPLARLVEGVWRALGIRRAPPLHRFPVDMLAISCTIDDGKIRRELGYRPVIDHARGLAALRG